MAEMESPHPALEIFKFYFLNTQWAKSKIVYW